VVDISGSGPGTPVAGAADWRVSEEAVAAIAALAASEVDGVALVGGSPLGRHGGRGVRVELGTREVALDVYLHVRYRARIPEVAQRVQERVREAVEGMTGLRVVQVDVYVQGLEGGSRPGALRWSGGEALPAAGPPSDPAAVE
jgi:uncharacterized alkaline shock family protein YloU